MHRHSPQTPSLLLAFLALGLGSPVVAADAGSIIIDTFHEARGETSAYGVNVGGALRTDIDEIQAGVALTDIRINYAATPPNDWSTAFFYVGYSLPFRYRLMWRSAPTPPTFSSISHSTTRTVRRHR